MCGSVWASAKEVVWGCGLLHGLHTLVSILVEFLHERLLHSMQFSGRCFHFITECEGDVCFVKVPWKDRFSCKDVPTAFCPQQKSCYFIWIILLALLELSTFSAPWNINVFNIRTGITSFHRQNQAFLLSLPTMYMYIARYWYFCKCSWCKTVGISIKETTLAMERKKRVFSARSMSVPWIPQEWQQTPTTSWPPFPFALQWQCGQKRPKTGHQRKTVKLPHPEMHGHLYRTAVFLSYFALQFYITSNLNPVWVRLAWLISFHCAFMLSLLSALCWFDSVPVSFFLAIVYWEDEAHGAVPHLHGQSNQGWHLFCVLAGWEPDHHCHIPGVPEENISQYIPTEANYDGKEELSKCSRYVNISVDNSTMPCDNGWYYKPEFDSTIVTEVYKSFAAEVVFHLFIKTASSRG